MRTERPSKLARRWRAGFAALLVFGVLFLWTGGLPARRGATEPWSLPLVDRDLPAIRKDTLRIAVVRDPLVYEERPGAITGLEYELLERFAAFVELPLAVVVAPSPDSLLPIVQRGEADIAAGLLNPHGAYEGKLSFSRAYRHSAPVLVQLREDRRLGKETVAPQGPALLPATFPFDAEGYAWSPDSLQLIRDAARQGEELLIEVILGHVDRAVLPDVTLRAEAARFPHLEFGRTLGPEVPLAFGVRRNANRLRKALDRWLKDPDEQEAREVLTQVYGGDLRPRGPLVLRSIHRPAQGGPISPYDSLFQAQQSLIPWDWELLAALAFKESRYDTLAIGIRGARGLMQVMPSTAEGLGLDSAHSLADHVRASARYLAQLDSIWMRSVKDPDQRLRFALASYNAGPGHVLDAQRLARGLGLDPAAWEGHVERALLLLAEPRFFTRPEARNGYVRGSLTFLYVRDIVGTYQRFRSLRELAGDPAGKEDAPA